MKLCWTWLGLVLVLVVGVGSAMAQDEPVHNDVYAISPDGTRMIAMGANWSLIDVGGGSHSLDQGDWEEIRIPPFAAWSPDGSLIAADLYKKGQHNLGMIDPDTLKIEIVVENTPTIQFVSWSPDSKRLLIWERESVYLWDGVNGELIEIADENANMVADYWAPWSPDSRFIAFGRGVLRVYDVTQHTFSENFMQDYEADYGYNTIVKGLWSPDSQHLAVSAAGDPNIYVVDIRKEGFTWLTDTKADDSFDLLSWSTDGAAIYYNLYTLPYPDSPGLYRVTMADGTITPLVMADAAFFFAPDGEHFLMFEDRHEDGEPFFTRAAIGDTETGEVSPIDLDHTWLTARLWSADSQYALVSACKVNEDDIDIFQINSETHAVVRVTEDGNDPEKTTCEGIG